MNLLTRNNIFKHISILVFHVELLECVCVCFALAAENYTLEVSNLAR